MVNNTIHARMEIYGSYLALVFAVATLSWLSRWRWRPVLWCAIRSRDDRALLAAILRHHSPTLCDMATAEILLVAKGFVALTIVFIPWVFMVAALESLR